MCNENIRNAGARQEIASIFRYDVSCTISVPDIHFHFVLLPSEYRSGAQSKAGYAPQLTESSVSLTVLNPVLGTFYM